MVQQLTTVNGVMTENGINIALRLKVASLLDDPVSEVVTVEVNMAPFEGEMVLNRDLNGISTRNGQDCTLRIFPRVIMTFAVA